jgi:phytanoyl-CoA dioxygenase PhyH
LNTQHRERSTIVSITGLSASTQAVHRSYEPYRDSVEEYVSFHKQGFLLVPILVPREDAQELIDHMNNLLAGRETIPGIAVPSFRQSPQEKLQYWLRVHMLHWGLPIHERFLDVLEALISPDVIALQSMLFFKQPAQLSGIEPITNASHTDEAVNGLTRVARKYPGREVKTPVDPGDVIFFGRHIMHRSHSNRSKTRLRRAFVGHHCNARSWIPLNRGVPYEGQSANYLHIGARGTTHLPHVEPHFGTPCVANQTRTPVSRSCGG